MKANKLCIVAIIVTSLTAGPLFARTVTEGTLDIREIVTEVTADLKEYHERKTHLVHDIDRAKKTMDRLSRGYGRAVTDSEKYQLKAESLDQASRFIDSYTQLLELTEKKAGSILPNLERIRKSVQEGVIGRQARALNDQDFRTSMKQFYGNMASLALMSKDPNLKQDVAKFLKESEMLYQSNSGHTKEFNNLLKNLDTITEKFQNAYVQAALRKKILATKKERLQIAIEMVKYSLALNSIQRGLDSINPDDFRSIPDVDFNIDGILETSTPQGSPKYNDPIVDQTLKEYLKGPKYLR
jgi:hypothetical protein